MSARSSAASSATRPLIDLRRVSVRYGARYALRDLTLAIGAGGHLGVSGGNGSGKSTLLRLIAGQLWPDPDTGGTRTYDFGQGPERDAVSARQRIRLVSPELQDRFAQQRARLTGAELVATGYADSPILREPPTAAGRQQVRKCLLRVGAAGLATRPFLALSRGEQRRLLIARALVSDPAILCLDEICDGLDPPAVARLLATLDRLAGQGLTLVMATHHPDEVPAAVRQWLTLAGGTPVGAADPAPPPAPGLAGPPLIAIRNADVWRGGRRVLAGVDWQLAAGESWLVQGGNGAGKSTFLKLLHGELRPALGGTISWFRLGPRPSVWDLRRRVALVSDELQALHALPDTARDCVATGFVASIGRVPPLDGVQAGRVTACLRLLGLESLAGVPLRSLSYGQLRRVLLARALVGAPEVLLLDEPDSGLDGTAREHLRAVLAGLQASGVCLVLAAHRADRLATLCNRRAVLERGRLRAA